MTLIAAVPVEPRARWRSPAALVCDAVGTLVDARGAILDAGSADALERARAAGLFVAVVHDGWPMTSRRLRDAVGPVDLVAVPCPDERTASRRDEVRPHFVRRTCRCLGVEPASCVVIGGRRPLLVAAAWAGARTVMVPNDVTPLFDLRGQCLAPDIATAIAAILDGVRT